MFTGLVFSFKLFFGNVSMPGSFFLQFVGTRWDLTASGKTRRCLLYSPGIFGGC